VLGRKLPDPLGAHTVHLDDVAEMHIRGLTVDGPQVQSFIATSNGTDGNIISDAIEIVNKHFPEEVKSGILPNNGYTATSAGKIDASAEEKILGIKVRSYEDQIVSVTKHYLVLVRNSA
jgi:nucleoside-diphosphate-sugar epimerase